MSLNNKQQLFLDHYLIHHNPQAAYTNAGYTSSNSNSAANKAHKLLKNTYIQSAIKEQQKKIMDATVITVADIVRDLKVIRDASLLKTEKGGLTDAKSALRALELLGKSIGAFLEKSEVNISTIKIVREEDTHIEDNIGEHNA